MSKVLKQVVFVFLAFVVLVVGVFIESKVKVVAYNSLDRDIVVKVGDGVTLLRDGSGKKIFNDEVLRIGDEIRTDSGGEGIIEYDDYGRIRLGENTSLVLRGKFLNGYVFSLKAGKVWVNSLYAYSHLNVVAGGALLIPTRSVFSVDFMNGDAFIKSFVGHVYVGLIGKNFSFNKILFSGDKSLINSFLVAQGGQAKISYSKVIKNVGVLGKLLYSKLIKEFNYSLIGDVKDDFYDKNVKLDKELDGIVKDDFVNVINGRNLRYGSLDSFRYKFDSALDNVFSLFTVVSSKKENRVVDHILNHLFDAEYLFLHNRVDDGNVRIGILKNMVDEARISLSSKFFKDILDRFKYEYIGFGYVDSGDVFMKLRDVVADMILQYGMDDDESFLFKLQIVRDAMIDAYLAADEGDDSYARASLGRYYKLMTSFADKYSDRKMISVLAEENQIMSNLLRQYSVFYTDAVFGVKYWLEEKWLSKILLDVDKDEEKRVIISDKIDFLKNVKRFFLNGQISLDDARAVTIRLINEIEDLQPSDDVAVNKLFDLRLKDYGKFLLFLNSTSLIEIRSSSPQMAYDDFVASRKGNVSVGDAINEVLGDNGENEEFNSSVVIDGIRNDFIRVGVDDVKVGEVNSAEQKIVSVNGVLNGVVFSCLYDWNKKIIVEVSVGGNDLASSSVALERLPVVIKKGVEMNEEKDVEESDDNSGEQVNKVAKVLLVQKFKSYSLEVGVDDIVVVDVKNGLYRVRNGYVDGYKDFGSVEFNFNDKTSMVSKLVLKGKDFMNVFSGEYELSKVVEVISDYVSKDK